MGFYFEDIISFPLAHGVSREKTCYHVDSEISSVAILVNGYKMSYWLESVVVIDMVMNPSLKKISANDIET